MKQFIAGTIFGLTLLSTAYAAGMAVQVTTNGTLVGYIVQHKGKVVCKNPGVWNQFRGPESYIVCD